eukprot:6298801-Prymnesium_polylepis.1
MARPYHPNMAHPYHPNMAHPYHPNMAHPTALMWQADIEQLQGEHKPPPEGLGAAVLRAVAAPIRVVADVA